MSALTALSRSPLADDDSRLAEFHRAARSIRETYGSEVILADAYRDAQKVKGQGDAQAASIYGRAFSKNPEFYAFYRSLEAYRGSFKSKSDIMVMEPNSEFFKYLKSSGKGK